jgi:CDP-glucose 4,6-dehydratase
MEVLVAHKFAEAFRNKRVLVTGHTGFKGSWLTQWLLDLGAQVGGLSLYIPSAPANFEVLGLERRITHHFVADIRNRDVVQEVFSKFQPEIVFHLAAQAIVRTSYDRPVETFETNLLGTVNVLEAVRQAPSVRTAVFITSDKCYENVEWEYGYRETDRLGGKDPYSASKACAEIAISSYARSFLLPARQLIASTRAGNVIGGGDWARDRIVPDCVRAWSSGETTIIRNPAATRPWQHVLEPLSGYLALAARLEAGGAELAGDSYNFGPVPEANYSVLQLIKEMQGTWDGKWSCEQSATLGKAEAGLLKLCCDKALERLSWRAALNFPETVAMTAAWYREYYGGVTDMTDFTRQQIDQYSRLAAERGIAWAM